MTNRARLHRSVLGAALATTAAVGFGNFAGWIPAMWSAIRTGSISGVTGGTDFSMFYAAATLGSEGRWDDVYSLEGLAEAMNATVGGVSFAYPPPFPMAMRALLGLEYSSALVVWLAVGLVAVGFLIGLYGWNGVLGVVAMVFPSYVAFRFGQFVPLAVLVLALTGWSLRRRHEFAAGLLLGLLVLKPQFLLGPLLVLVFSQHRRSALFRGAISSSAMILLGSVAAAPEAWRSFVSAVTEIASPNVGTRWDFSIVHVFDMLPGGAGLFVASVVAVGFISMAARTSSRSPDLTVVLGLGVILSLLISPRVVVYDWMLLAVPFAWLSQRLTFESQLTPYAAVVAIASLSGYLSAGRLAWVSLAALVVALTTVERSPFSSARLAKASDGA